MICLLRKSYSSNHFLFMTLGGKSEEDILQAFQIIEPVINSFKKH